MTTIRIAHLSIGDELLDGRIKDGNVFGLGTSLAMIGLELVEARIVPDVRLQIVSSLQSLASVADVIVTSGGLGPTSDDVTAECVAAAAGVGLRFDEPAFARMTAMFEARGVPMPPSNRRQAMLPSTSSTLENQMGTAPGFVTPLPHDGRVVQVWSFPGVPREYEHLRDDALLPALRARLDGEKPTTLVRRTLRSLGLAESAIGERLAAFEQAHPEVRVQYRAAFPEVVVRLVLQVPADADLVDTGRRADALAHEARAAIGKSVWGVGDEPLEQRVLDRMRARGLTIAVAESCTGGLLAKRLTDQPGSSDVVLGGVVAYANSVKQSVLDVSGAELEAHGAVSANVAEAMARGARTHLRADLAISVTGVAGPSGGTSDKPVGTVWFGIADATGTTSVHKKFPDFGRERIREMTAATALRLVLEHVEQRER
jgi:nicotinamide-nucleotide amidase